MPLRVLRAGPRTTVQDLGRLGMAHLGVPRAGAVDRHAHRRANHAAGNPASAATLEITLGGLLAEAVGELTVAVAGARVEAAAAG
jgi:allophanate hydrolase subunit 2